MSIAELGQIDAQQASIGDDQAYLPGLAEGIRQHSSATRQKWTTAFE